MVRTYGQDIANRLENRLETLINASNLSKVPIVPPDRCHLLTGDRAGQFSVDVSRNVRLIFEPDHDPVPSKPDGGIDKEAVTDIIIIEIADYH